MKHTKIKMGDIETDTVCYDNNLVAHRLRKDGKPEFSADELRYIIKCWNSHDDLLTVCITAHDTLLCLHVCDQDKGYADETRTLLRQAIAEAEVEKSHYNY